MHTKPEPEQENEPGTAGPGKIRGGEDGAVAQPGAWAAFRTLLRLGRAIRRNRWRGRSALGRAGLLLGSFAAVAGLALLGASLLRVDDPAGLDRRVEAWAFWCMAATALVFGYTSFETVYRDPVARRLARQPVPASSLFAWKLVEVYRRHLPLLLLPLSSGAPLFAAGMTGGFLRGVGTTGAALLFGLCAAVSVHVHTGRMLLGEGPRIRGLVPPSFGPPESALLFYGPAIALAVAVSVGVLVDLSIGTGVARGVWGPFFSLAGILAIAAIAALWKARAVFVATWHRMAPRFADAEVLPPWREDDLPRRYFGERLGRILPAGARPLWRRDLLQYRRRFRLVVPLLVVAAAGLLAYALHTADAAGGPLRLSAAAAITAIVAFTPVFRSAGPDLGARFDARALPVGARDERRIQWVLAATEWAPLAAAATAAGLLAGFGLGTLVVPASLLVAFVVTNIVAIPLGLRASPDVGALSIAVRGGLVLLVGAAAALADVVAR